MKQKSILAILLLALLILFAVEGIAATVGYSGRTLPKIYSAIDPNVFLQTTGRKQEATLSARHYFSYIDGSAYTQAVRMWRDDGASVTRTLWHYYSGPYSMGVGSTTLIPEHTYTVYARGNTSNAGAVVVYGWVDAEGGNPI